LKPSVFERLQFADLQPRNAYSVTASVSAASVQRVSNPVSMAARVQRRRVRAKPSLLERDAAPAGTSPAPTGRPAGPKGAAGPPLG
jgi:hypothetical protein